MNAPTSDKLSLQEYDERKSCLEEIKQLSKEQYEGLFFVLKRNGIAHTENSNGIFFDLTSLSMDQFYKVREFLQLCTTQNQNEQERTKELQTLREEAVAK
jgi:hypothetical protein